jgi:hypothetical protein
VGFSKYVFGLGFGIYYIGGNMENKDVVQELIIAKQQKKVIEEKIEALENIILSDPIISDDERISIVDGRKTITINDEAYEILESVGVKTLIIETRKKKLEEFDVEIQQQILSNPENFVMKVGKASVRVKEIRKKVS